MSRPWLDSKAWNAELEVARFFGHSNPYTESVQWLNLKIVHFHVYHINHPQSLDPFGPSSVYSWFKKPLSLLHSGLEFE